MRYAQNKGLASTQLRIGAQVYQGDAQGVFALADEDAARVLGTPGWTEVGGDSVSAPAPSPADALAARLRPPAAEPAPLPPAASPPLPEAPTPPPEPPVAEGESEGGAVVDPIEEEGPDLSAIATKVGLLAVAEQYDVHLTAAEKRLPIDDLRTVLDRRLYG